MHKIPCRIDVFSTALVQTHKRRKPVMRPIAWQDWNDDIRMERGMARLPGSGSFYYASARKAWRRAHVLIRRGAEQVKVETISGVEVGRLYAPDGESFNVCGVELSTRRRSFAHCVEIPARRS